MFYRKGVYVNGIAFGCANLMAQTAVPFMNALATEMLNIGKSINFSFARGVGSLYLVQILQPMGWGLMTVSSVYFVNMLMEDRDTIKGQVYMTMTLSAGTIIGSLIGGGLIDMAGIPGMLSVAVICGAAGTYIVLHMTRRAKE